MNTPKTLEMSRFHVLRILNNSRTKMVMCRYEQTGTWTLPIASKSQDVYAYVEVVDFIKTYFKSNNAPFSVIYLDEIETETEKEIVNTVIYEVEFEDSDSVDLNEFGDFDIVQWVTTGFIHKESTKINLPTLESKKMLSKE